MKMIDLYSGIGGASLGFKQAGYEPAFGCDTDQHAQLVYAHNFKLDSRHDAESLKANDLPHPEVLFAAPPERNMSAVANLLRDIQCRCIMFEFPGRMMNKAEVEKKHQVDLLGYKCWQIFLNAKDFGVPQDREMYYMVGFRKDVKAPFFSFPFPEPSCSTKTLADILEPTPDAKLFLTAKQLEAVQKRNDKNAAAGTGFKTRILTPSEISPTIPLKYHKCPKNGILVDSGNGPRRFSVLECRRLMGFPDDYAMPISDTNAYRLLAQASCPPLVAAVAAEVRDWISY